MTYSQNQSSAFSILLPKISPLWSGFLVVRSRLFCRDKLWVDYANTLLFRAKNGVNAQKRSSQPMKGKLQYVPDTWARPVPVNPPGPGSIR